MMHGQTEKAKEGDLNARIVMMRTVYYLAKNSKPNSDFVDLMELQALNGCPELKKADTYCYHSVVNDMEQCVADVISNEIKQAIHESSFVSFLLTKL